ncbi:hypothetical protein KVV02_005941 [Mortierella alpina]|uniref:VWFA domain-containing protein n=1 Tax=Mortierella alpina TaxID=64518 RepID=A0A9P8IHM6_MORAP|nr:hypothetical protein KVV02_005941 [Mortierella alpina]
MFSRIMKPKVPPQANTSGPVYQTNTMTFGAPQAPQAPAARGRNRANDAEFQELKATYLAEFDFKGIHCTATPLYDSVIRGVNTELPVLFQLKVGQRAHHQDSDMVRTPFNAVLVLDNSGSMGGSRLENCKTAINTIIHTLTPHDTLSLVIYDSKTETIFVDCNHTHKKMMLDAVASIQVRGCTNLHAGLELGVKTLRSSMKKESEQDLKRNAHRVFLFSDGLVNEGITSPSVIESHVKEWIGSDISISTFGIGDDYDEKLMKAIAQAANGDSFFIETEADIEDMVSKGLRGVSNMIAPAATLTVRGLGDAVIKDIPGYDQTTPGQVTIRNLRTNGLVQLVVNLDIRVPGLDDFSEHDMEDVEALKNKKNILGYSLTLEGEHFVDLADCVGLSDTVSVNYTTDSTKVSDDKKNNDVVAFLTIKEAARIDREVVEHLANNRTTEALSAKKKVISMYGAIAPIDRWGFSKVMQNQSERLVKDLETSGNTRFAQKMSAQQQQEASDDDMGFGLYD